MINYDPLSAGKTLQQLRGTRIKGAVESFMEALALGADACDSLGWVNCSVKVPEVSRGDITKSPIMQIHFHRKDEGQPERTLSVEISAKPDQPVGANMELVLHLKHPLSFSEALRAGAKPTMASA